jgi:hypothetical protein
VHSVAGLLPSGGPLIDVLFGCSPGVGSAGSSPVVRQRQPLPDGSVRAWRSDWEPIEHLAVGPGLIDLHVASPTTLALTDMPYGGVHFDPHARTVSLRAVQNVAGIHNWPLPGWENWGPDFRGDLIGSPWAGPDSTAAISPACATCSGSRSSRRC